MQRAMKQAPDAVTHLDPEVCHRALRARDARFDGRFFVGVTTTGIYCRPICPAVPAKIAHCRFFPSAAAAQASGFRPCLRCRPEIAPELGVWRGTSSTVSRGLALIADGHLDGDEASVDRLAERLGVSGRQLRRLFRQHLGASPLAVAQTRRVHFAKQLLHDTRLPMAEVALASGFGSVRRFNETFRRLYRRPPSALRRSRAPELREGTTAASGVTVRLRYRAPYCWPAMLAHLAARAVDGVERVDGAVYRRVIREGGETGTVEIAHLPKASSLGVTIRFPVVRKLAAIVARVRHAFDLDADVAEIGACLSQDPVLAPSLAARPGLRVPGAWDPFELAARAVLGQQISVRAARSLAARLARVAGTPLPAGQRFDPALAVAFPDAAQVARADLATLRMPEARRRALRALALAALDDPHLFESCATVDETVAKLRAIPGVGEWTAHVIALRAAREPDAFPAGDVGLLRALARPDGTRPTQASLRARAERWRPWRGYAAQHLWTEDAASHEEVKDG